MAETLIDVRSLPREAAYAMLESHIAEVLDGLSDPIAAMATMSCLLYHGFGHLWVGFYRVVEPEALLRVGPYQGSLGCLEIRFGSGVCGTAAEQRRTVIVSNVDEFPGHITCDPRSRSEIVVPAFDGKDRLIAVLDIDSDQPTMFNDVDAHGLEYLMKWFTRM